MKRIISTSKAPEAIGPYSQAIEANNMLFISGQISLHPETGEIIGETTGEQTEQVLRNLSAVLEAAGYTLENVVKTTCMLDNMDDFQEMNAVYNHYFGDVLPARAAFEVSSLPKRVKIEIDAIAVK